MSIPTLAPVAPNTATAPSPGVTTTPTTPAVNVTPPNPAPATGPGQPEPKFEPGKFVNHPGSGDGTLLAGVGKVVAVDGETVTVECDWMGQKRNSNYKETDLTKVD